MSIVVVDTNIIFSALRSKNSKIRLILENTAYSFYTPNFLVEEIFKHKERIVEKSLSPESEIYEFLHKVLQNIHFANESSISLANAIHAYRLCSDIDEKDTPFVALTLELEGKLWTRDEVLKQGLINKKFTNFFDESQA